jgi:hypothetical protein
MERRALARAARTRRAVESGSLEAAVLASARLAGVRPSQLTAAPRPVAGVPAAIAGPVSSLLGAMQVAGDVTTHAIHGSPPLLGRLLSAVERISNPRSSTPAAMRAAAGQAEHLLRLVRAHVDQRSITGAAALVARTIDRTLPQLRAFAATPHAAVAVPIATGCDMLDATPALCIGGSGDNTFTADEALTIDLGGNDTYRNSAGGAQPTVTHIPVSVVLDLGGNDIYASTVPDPSGGIAVQGAAVDGIGILLDTSGDDTYSVTDAVTVPGQVAAQGAGLEGVGILADLAGNDSYSVLQTAPGTPAGNPSTGIDGSAYVQGYGSAGHGILLDRSATNDTYDVQARPPLALSDDMVRAPSPLTNGFGVGGLGGVGLWSDDGGTDAATLEATSPTITLEDSTLEGLPPTPETQGFGTGIAGGTGMVLAGPGKGTFTERATTQGPYTDVPRVFGFGEATLGATAMFSTSGGDDTYRAETIATATQSATADDECGCTGASAQTRTWGAKTVAFGIGYGGLFGEGAVGLMQDSDGNDSYTAIANARATSTAIDNSSTASPDGADAEAIAGAAVVEGEGFGGTGAAGFLLDENGNDTYEIQASSTADAHATAVAAGTAVQELARTDGATTYGQASGVTGFGELFDGGGNDSYAASAASAATADAESTVTRVAPAIVAQAGSTLGSALFLDQAGSGTDNDAFQATPDVPPCQGTRGQDVWADCGPSGSPGAGIGINR